MKAISHLDMSKDRNLYSHFYNTKYSQSKSKIIIFSMYMKGKHSDHNFSIKSEFFISFTFWLQP